MFGRLILILPFPQICVAPDYVLIPRSAQDAFVEAVKEAAAELHLDDALTSDSYGSIVSDGHYKRLRNLMTKSSGEIVVGGDTDEEKRRITPTVYRDVKEGDSLLEGYSTFLSTRGLDSLCLLILLTCKTSEIFGPLLPIVPVDDIRGAIEYVNAQ